MKNVDTWPVLYESMDLRRARMVAACVAAMEFEVQVAAAADADRERYFVQVPAADLDGLLEVIDEILQEQEHFDSSLLQWRHHAARGERRLLLAMIIVVATLAAIGAIEV